MLKEVLCIDAEPLVNTDRMPGRAPHGRAPLLLHGESQARAAAAHGGLLSGGVGCRQMRSAAAEELLLRGLLLRLRGCPPARGPAGAAAPPVSRGRGGATVRDSDGGVGRLGGPAVYHSIYNVLLLQSQGPPNQAQGAGVSLGPGRGVGSAGVRHDG